MRVNDTNKLESRRDGVIKVGACPSGPETMTSLRHSCVDEGPRSPPASSIGTQIISEPPS